jgi:hypothetical protein
MADGKGIRLVETICDGCVIRLLWFYGDRDSRWNWIDVQVVSNHLQAYHSRWHSRIRNAWAAIRNRYDWSGFQLNTSEEATALRAALDEAIRQTWPQGQPSQGGGEG